ncbi:major facilitator superfamily domain-containing protein [Thelonectria olida]|uniref:Major facilitator superfamily domain-containing protein n=1 Tax=Thelonectria olida TaxID=1576542 RepID=A0A9P8WBG3_9HYPO|nr:major facilitator superfamily domain-containing protein [Thelonectria olida]
MRGNGSRSTSRGDDEEQRRVESDECTPLLKSAGPDGPQRDATATSHVNGENGVLNAQQRQQEEETTVIADETSFTKLALIMGTAWVGVFLGAIDSTIIATLSAPISSEFNSLSLLSWLATAYLISNAACQPISGRLTDIFGRGPGLVFSNVFFAAGNLICGLAKDQSVMILGRVVAGIGGGGLMSISTFLASDLIPLRRRGIAQGIGNLCYGSGAMLGGVFGGLLNDHTKLGWRLAFLIQVPPSILSAIAVAILVRVPPKQSDKSYLARIDFGGVFLTAVFLILLLLGLNSGGNIVPWTHPLPLTTIPLSIVTFVLFFFWEKRVRQPIIPVRLLLDRTVLSACLCNLLGTMVVMAGLFYVPLYLQVLGSSATQAGVQLLPSPIGISVGSLTVGYLMARTGRYITLGVSGVSLLVVGAVLLSIQNEHTPPWLPSIAFFFAGSGYGAMLTTTMLACIAAVDHSQQAVITSATYLARSLGGTVGITIGSVVYQNILVTRLWDRFGDEPHAGEEIRRIRDDLNELKHLPEGWHDGVIASFMEAFRGVWLTLLGISVLALIVVSFMRQHTLHSTLERR